MAFYCKKLVGWLKPYIDINTELRKKSKKEKKGFEKEHLFNLMHNPVF